MFECILNRLIRKSIISYYFLKTLQMRAKKSKKLEYSLMMPFGRWWRTLSIWITKKFAHEHRNLYKSCIRVLYEFFIFGDPFLCFIVFLFFFLQRLFTIYRWKRSGLQIIPGLPTLIFFYGRRVFVLSYSLFSQPIILKVSSVVRGVSLFATWNPISYCFTASL